MANVADVAQKGLRLKQHEPDVGHEYLVSKAVAVMLDPDELNHLGPQISDRRKYRQVVRAVSILLDVTAVGVEHDAKQQELYSIHETGRGGTYEGHRREKTLAASKHVQTGTKL